MILSTALGATILPYIWDEPTATDALGQLITNVIKTHEPGALFTLGQTAEVTYMFTDSSGNKDTCTFTVTVSGEIYFFYPLINLFTCITKELYSQTCLQKKSAFKGYISLLILYAVVCPLCCILVIIIIVTFPLPPIIKCPLL